MRAFRRSVFGAITLAALMCLSCASFAQENETGEQAAQIQLSDLVQQVNGGQIDWERQMMYATGEAVVPEPSKVPNRAVALLKAKDYAKMEAIANLFMVVEGTTISYEGSGKDFMSRDAALHQKIQGYLRNVEIIKWETVQAGGERVVRVTVGTRVYGDRTPGGAFLEKLADTEKPRQAPLIQIPLEKSYPRPSKPTAKAAREADQMAATRLQGPASARPVDIHSLPVMFTQQGPFTSLVVDARGYNVPQAICPKIRKLNGDQIYGSVRDKTDAALNDGLVGYARTPEKAKTLERCGNNPLLVTAVGRGGGRYMCDVIVSDESARLIEEENAKTGFLEQYRVILVVDPPGSAIGSSQL